MPDLLKEIEAQIAGAKVATDRQNVGVIREVGDGVAKVEGLADAMLNEMLDLGHGITGLALNLEETEVGVIILGDYTQLEEGDEVRTTGKLLQVPVGKGLLGRVVNTLGEPLDGAGPVESNVYYPVEKIAPGIIRRSPVRQPVQTGIMAIDAMIPIGRGQRELIIGDRSTGKTTICIDTIISQARLNRAAETAGDRNYRPLYCIYVAIGQKQSNVARIITALEQAGAMPTSIRSGRWGRSDRARTAARPRSSWTTKVACSSPASGAATHARRWELWMHSAGTGLWWPKQLAPGVRTRDVAWHPAGYAVVAGSLQDSPVSTVFWAQAWIPGADQPWRRPSTATPRRSRWRWPWRSAPTGRSSSAVAARLPADRLPQRLASAGDEGRAGGLDEIGGDLEPRGVVRAESVRHVVVREVPQHQIADPVGRRARQVAEAEHDHGVFVAVLGVEDRLRPHRRLARRVSRHVVAGHDRHHEQGVVSQESLVAAANPGQFRTHRGGNGRARPEAAAGPALARDR